MNVITVDDLANPQISERGREILAERETLPVDFSISGILRYAEEISDVPIYKDAEALASLERFLLEGDQRCGFSLAGKKMLAVEMANIIVQRSRLEALFISHPEIAEIEVQAPIIIAGIPRSGTTNLSNIMASDSRLRSLSFWESKTPIPSQEEIAAGASEISKLSEAERTEIGRQALEDIHAVMPMTQLMYDISFDNAAEELCFMALAGCPLMYMPHVYAPEWNQWFYNEMDPLKMYRLVKRSVQALNWLQGESKRWVLKSPHHLGFLPALNQVFPDAHLVVTHRDPASSTISNATMNAYVFREVHTVPEPKDGYHIAIDMADGMIGGLARDIDAVNFSSVSHIHFHDYMADVMGTLQSIYQAVGLEFTDQARRELQGYIDAHPRGRHGGKLGYNPERDFAVTRNQVRERYQEYIEKFSIQIEETHA